MRMILILIVAVVVGAVSLGIVSVETGNADLTISYDSEKAEQVVGGVVKTASDGFGLLDKEEE